MTAFTAELDILELGDITLVGVPLDENASFLRGPALAPLRIRESLFTPKRKK